ncbi:MAG: diacylglycerol kinase family protein [Gammaproteobacteria bacterium]
MRTAIIVNPVAGRGSSRVLANQILELLHESGLNCTPHYSSAPLDAVRLVKNLAETHERILVAGGDGTWCEAVDGAMRATNRPVLGLIPVGTGNDFAKMLGYGNDWREACRRAADGHTRPVDIGRCRYGENLMRYFANGAGIGFDAQVSREARRIRYLHGNAVYLLAVARTLLLRYTTPHVMIEHDTGTLHQTITLIAAANGRCYGGAFHIAPDAEIDDGYLELVSARGLGRLHILRLLPKVLAGHHIGDPAISTLRTRRVTIRSTVPLPLHLDGEVIADEATHLEIEILPGALNVFA